MSSFFGKLSAAIVYPEFFPLGSSDVVLNIGCGQGAQAAIYAGSYARMVGVDVNDDRLRLGNRHFAELGIRAPYETVVGNVEVMPFHSASFDKVIAIDIVEHVKIPERMLAEAMRLLRSGGELLITFPAMHDRYVAVGYFIRHGAFPSAPVGWDPDAHNTAMGVSAWIRLVEGAGFGFIRARATTIFPPLHLYGIPRFWFTNRFVHTIDRFFCSIPMLMRAGQTVMCVFRKS